MSDISRKALLERSRELAQDDSINWKDKLCILIGEVVSDKFDIPSTESEVMDVRLPNCPDCGNEFTAKNEEAYLCQPCDSSYPYSSESEGEALNQERYDQARKLVEGWNVWHDHKLLIYSVIDRAIHLEREVARLLSHREDAGTEIQVNLTHNDLFQLQSLVNDNGADAIIGLIRSWGIKDGRDTDVTHK